MKKLLLALFVISFSSCIKDYKSSTATYLHNETEHTIEIAPYKDGLVVSGDAKIIQPNERQRVYDDSPYGRSLAPCWGRLIQPYDSVVVTFDASRRTVHLSFRDTTRLASSGYLRFVDSKNITNEDSYKEIITESNKNYLVGYYEYTFTEADYEFAKD